MCETSNSSWAELESYVIGSIQMFPPTHSTRQMLILRYLTPMGEYQEVNKAQKITIVEITNSYFYFSVSKSCF